MESIKPTETVFYAIEEAIKSYRKFSQKAISHTVNNLTIDQSWILHIIDENPKTSQKNIGEIIFKDKASVTRIIHLLIDKNYLEKTVNGHDRREYSLSLTIKGKEAVKKLEPVIEKNRQSALQNINGHEVKQLIHILSRITKNCHS